MRRNNFKNKLLTINTLAIIALAPVVISISCGKNNKKEASNGNLETAESDVNEIKMQFGVPIQQIKKSVLELDEIVSTTSTSKDMSQNEIELLGLSGVEVPANLKGVQIKYHLILVEKTSGAPASYLLTITFSKENISLSITLNMISSNNYIFEQKPIIYFEQRTYNLYKGQEIPEIARYHVWDPNLQLDIYSDDAIYSDRFKSTTIDTNVPGISKRSFWYETPNGTRSEIKEHTYNIMDPMRSFIKYNERTTVKIGVINFRAKDGSYDANTNGYLQKVFSNVEGIVESITENVVDVQLTFIDGGQSSLTLQQISDRAVEIYNSGVINAKSITANDVILIDDEIAQKNPEYFNDYDVTFTNTSYLSSDARPNGSQLPFIGSMSQNSSNWKPYLNTIIPNQNIVSTFLTEAFEAEYQGDLNENDAVDRMSGIFAHEMIHGLGIQGHAMGVSGLTQDEYNLFLQDSQSLTSWSEMDYKDVYALMGSTSNRDTSRATYEASSFLEYLGTNLIDKYDKKSYSSISVANNRHARIHFNSYTSGNEPFDEWLYVSFLGNKRLTKNAKSSDSTGLVIRYSNASPNKPFPSSVLLDASIDLNDEIITLQEGETFTFNNKIRIKNFNLSNKTFEVEIL